MKKIGFLGPAGTYSKLALTKYLAKNQLQATPVGLPDFFKLFKSIQNNELDEIIIPIENSIEGSVNINFDLLINTTNLYFKQEVILEINNCLLSKTKHQLLEITDVFSHLQPIAQCQLFLASNLSQAKKHVVSSTAQAAKNISENTLDLNPQDIPAVIGNKELAKIYDLQVLSENINDYKNNFTRFVVISREESKPSEQDKTFFIFAIKKDTPGGLYGILGEFAKRDINLTHISSRPTKNELGEYLFFIDLEGHKSDKKIAEALETIKSKTDFFKLLGSYKKDVQK
jgi:prephenate dehydratase